MERVKRKRFEMEEKMDILKIGVLGVAGVLLVIPIRQYKPEYGALMGLAVCICIFVYTLTRLQSVLDTIAEMVAMTGVEKGYIRTIIKMLGITYISEFSSDLCRESGHSSIATQIEMFAKISLFALSMPILCVLLETIGDFL